VIGFQLGGVAAIAQRDVLKLLRDRARLAVNLAFPVLLIAGLGSVLGPTVGKVTGLNSVTLAFTGVLPASLFQSVAAGMISIVEDRETDFARVLFVTPISRFALIAGKVGGESLVALVQAGFVVVLAAVFGVPVRFSMVFVVVLLACCLCGAGFGLVTVAALPNQRSAMQVFQFLIIPQYLLAGVLVPLRGVSAWLGVVSAAMPLRYLVDLTRAVYYSGTSSYGEAVTGALVGDVVLVVGFTAVFLLCGGLLFSYRERSR